MRKIATMENTPALGPPSRLSRWLGAEKHHNVTRSGRLMTTSVTWPLIIFNGLMPAFAATTALEEILLIQRPWFWAVGAMVMGTVAGLAMYLLLTYRPLARRSVVVLCGLPWLLLGVIVLLAFAQGILAGVGRFAVAALVVPAAGPLTTIGRWYVGAGFALLTSIPVILLASPAMAFYVVLMFTTTHSSMWYLAIVDELEEAQQIRAELAVVDERLRFSRDLHDVVGRWLAVISLTAETASELATRGDERAIAQTRRIQELADEARRDVHSLVAGYRQVDVQRELDGAAGLLRSVGAEVSISVRGTYGDDDAELFTAAIQEATTNILRHAAPTRVDIAVDHRCLIVTNDGVLEEGTPEAMQSIDGGHGLIGLAERARAAGGSLVHYCQGNSFVLQLDLKGTS